MWHAIKIHIKSAGFPKKFDYQVPETAIDVEFGRCHVRIGSNDLIGRRSATHLFLMDSKSSRNVWHPAHISAFPVEL
jgi:hypothetical protein